MESAVDLPVSDGLAFRIAGRSIDRDGYQDNVADNALRGENKYWDEDSYGFRLTMDLDVGQLSNLTVVSHDESDMLARMPIAVVFNPQSQLGALFNAIHNGGLGIGGTAIDDAIDRQQRRDGHEIESDVLAKESVENALFANATEYEVSDRLSIKTSSAIARWKWPAPAMRTARRSRCSAPLRL